MKILMFVILITVVFISACEKNVSSNDSNYTNIEHLQDIILEIDDREMVVDESNIFNAYAYAIKIKSNGEYETFDDAGPEWISWMENDKENFLWTF